MSFAFSPESRRLVVATGGSDGMKLWDVTTHENVLSLAVPDGDVQRARLSPDGNVIATAASSGTLWLWRAPSWQEIESAEASARLNAKSAGHSRTPERITVREKER